MATKAFKLPKSVKLGAYIIPVVREEIPEEHDCSGYFINDEDGSRIVVDSRLEGIAALETFLHELLHAIDRHTGGGDLPHRQVFILANGLTQALQKNLKF